MIRDRHANDAASRPAHERLRRRLLLARLRFAATMGLVFLALGAVLNVCFAPDRLGERLLGFALQIGICVAGIGLAAQPEVARRATGLAMGFIIAIGSSLFYTLGLSPTDLDVMTAPITCIMIGSTLFFPWGGTRQAVVSGVMAAGYALFLWPYVDATGMRATNVAISVGLSTALSVVGAAVLERSRRTTYAERQRVRELAVQRRHLIDIGRNLRSTLEDETISARLLEHAARLIPADAVSLVLWDPQARVYRVEGVRGDARLENLVGVDWPDSYRVSFCAAFPPAEIREVPGSTLDQLVIPALTHLGIQRVLFAAIGPHPEPAGFISWARRADEPFARGHRLAAQGIADQANTTLAAARLYGEAARASQLKTQFVSTMSHELRTPLNVIMGYNQILSETVPPDPETMHALDAMQRASLELLELIQGTLDIGRLEAGREELEEEPIAVRALFDELAREFAPVPRAPDVALVWDVTDLPPFVSDRRKVKTVLKNLVGNALKFTPAGSVRAECRLVGETFRFRVIDTGIGIRAEDQAVIFDMFRQGDSSDTRRYGGTGLGLYIVRQLVPLLRGTVTVESAPGRGSTFTVTLPVGGVGSGRAQAAA